MAEEMRGVLAEPEFDALLICETDFDIAAVAAAKSASRVTRRSCSAHRAARSVTSSRRDNNATLFRRPAAKKWPLRGSLKLAVGCL
jgi:hypothetical protein